MAAAAPPACLVLCSAGTTAGPALPSRPPSSHTSVERACPRVSRWSALLDERPGHPGARLLGFAWVDGGRGSSLYINHARPAAACPPPLPRSQSAPAGGNALVRNWPPPRFIDRGQRSITQRPKAPTARTPLRARPPRRQPMPLDQSTELAHPRSCYPERRGRHPAWKRSPRNCRCCPRTRTSPSSTPEPKRIQCKASPSTPFP